MMPLLGAPPPIADTQERTASGLMFVDLIRTSDGDRRRCSLFALAGGQSCLKGRQCRFESHSFPLRSHAIEFAH
jgi:hypothetical protein